MMIKEGEFESSYSLRHCIHASSIIRAWVPACRSTCCRL